VFNKVPHERCRFSFGEPVKKVATSPLYPMPHKQSVALSLPVGAYELDGHGLHCVADVAPRLSWYVSAGQLTQSLLVVAVLYLPTGHTAHW
jgi:hypothetical protein